MRFNIREPIRATLTKPIKNFRSKLIAGELPEGYCYLVDDEENLLVDDSGRYLVSTCT